MSQPLSCHHGFSDINGTCEQCQKELNDIPFRRIELLARELEESRKEIERLKTTVETLASHLKSCAASRNAHAVNFRKSEVKRIEAEREVERLKAKSQSDFENREREFREMNRVLNGLRGLWKHLPNIENKYDERLTYHLDELIERLKADKARLDWLEKAKSAEYCEGPRGWSLNGWSGPYSDTLRDAIDAAMKGDAL